MTHLVAIDTGGTFTDLAAYSLEDGRITYAKSLTTHHDLVEGIAECVAKVELDLATVSLFKHGTTLIINTLLERTGAHTALVTTCGFRDVLAIGRGNRPQPFDLFYRRDPPLVPRRLRHELSERTDGDGQAIVVLDRAEVEALAAVLKAEEVRAVAVSFLNSYRSPEHEHQVARWLGELLPGVFVTCGADLSREWYEFERTATVAANAYVGPRMAGYLGRLDGALRAREFGGQFFLMGSNGGVLSVERALAEPVILVESGPVGGCIGAAAYADMLGLDNVIAFDMGGTTAKCGLIQNGRFDVKSVYWVGGYERGFPIRGAVIDIVEVGAGGGSIAWLDDQGRLYVGPRSAGSNPGPVAYRRGGVEPTVTDANLVLGRLDPAGLLGGELTLDIEAARRAIGERVASPLGFVGDEGIAKTADGILSIAAVIMAGAIKRITIEWGRDPRDFALFAYGGGGPLHAADLARELHIPRVVVPPEPGNFSAIGMLLADVRRDQALTFLRPLSAASVSEMHTTFRGLEGALEAGLRAETGSDTIGFTRHAELRYRGQVHSVLTAVDGIADPEAMAQAFERVYRTRYGHADSGNPIEIVGLRATACARMPRPDLGGLNPNRDVRGEPSMRTRRIYFAQVGGAIASQVYRRRELPVGFQAAGPAVIEEYGSTTVVGPTDRFEIGRLGEISIDIGAVR